MTPLRLRASNYRTFGDLDVTFEHGLTGILGELRDAPEGADSNGAGKSSILEAIDIALFGRRSLAGCLTRGGIATELMLELTFEHAGDHYRVRRSYSARGRGKTTVDLERHTDHYGPGAGPHLTEWEPLTCESAKETQAAIERTIGLSHATFCNSSYLRQGDGSYADPARDPAERKKLLAEAALGRDPVWPRALDAAKHDRKQAEQELQRLAGVTTQLEFTVEKKSAVAADLDTARTDAAATHAALQAAETRIAELEERYRAAAELAAKRQTLQAQLATARAALDQLQLSDVTATEAVTAIKSAREELTTLPSTTSTDELVKHERDLVAAIDSHRTQLQAHQEATAAAAHADSVRAQHQAAARAAEAAAAALRAKADELEKAAGEQHCETCGQTLTDEARVRAIASYMEEARQHDTVAREQTLRAENVAAVNVPAAPEGEPPAAELADVRAQLARGQQQMQQRARLEERIAQLQPAVDARPAIDAITSARAQVAARIQDLDAITPVDIAAVKRDGEQARARVVELRQLAATRDAIVIRHQAALERITEAETELAAAAAQRTGLQTVVDECLVIERAFGRDGVPALILENRVIPSLETEATRILSELGTGYQVELRTQQATKDGGLRDTLEVVIIDDTGEAPYDDFSGGEQTRIGLALRIALARLLAQRRGAESRLLALDEPSYLDQAGMTALLDVLRRLQDDFDTILLVSHVPELRDALDQTIVVVKDTTGSRIEGAPEREAVPV